MPCAACRPSYLRIERHFLALAADWNAKSVRVDQLEADLDAEMNFMTDGPFGRHTTSRVTARIRTYESGVWTGWKGYGRRRANGAIDGDRYTRWWVEPTNQWRIEGAANAVQFRALIAQHGLRQAVNRLLAGPRRHHPQPVTVDWLLNAAEPRRVRRRFI